MKTAACIILLVLLLCNMLALSLTVLYFDNGYKNASINITTTETQTIKIPLPSIPYAAPLALDDVENHLLRISDGFYNVTQFEHINDTLFVTLTPDASARQRFAETAIRGNCLSSLPARSIIRILPVIISKPLKSLPNCLLSKQLFPRLLSACYIRRKE